MGTEATGERVIGGRHVDWMPMDEGDGKIGVWMDDGGNPIGWIDGDEESGFHAEAFFGGVGFSAQVATLSEAVQALYENQIAKEEAR